LTAAAGTRADVNTVSIVADALPPQGFVPIGTATVGTGGQLLPQAFYVGYLHTATPAQLFGVMTVDCDTATEALLRVFSVDQEPISVAGHAGWAGHPLYDSQATQYIWRAGSALVILTVGIKAASLTQAVLNSLRPVSATTAAQSLPNLG